MFDVSNKPLGVLIVYRPINPLMFTITIMMIPSFCLPIPYKINKVFDPVLFKYMSSYLVISDCNCINCFRLLQLKSNISLSDAVSKVKQLTGLQHVRFALGKGKLISTEIQTVALCAGSGSSVLKGAAAELYLTGNLLIYYVAPASEVKIVQC